MRQKGTQNKVQAFKAKVRGDKSAVQAQRSKLRALVSTAKGALSKAKAQPFDKRALKKVVSMRLAVKRNKEKLIAMAKHESLDQKKVVALKKLKFVKKKVAAKKKLAVKKVVALKKLAFVKKKFAAKKKVAVLKKMFPLKNGKPTLVPKAASKAAVPGTKKNTVRHPADPNHLDKAQIKYWANKKMKYRSGTPLKKTQVMAKIFAIKQQEANTLTKINEVNIAQGMKSKGVRAGMMNKGKNVIVDGELIKPDTMVKLSTAKTFNGPAPDPRLNPKSRDPRTDKMKQMTKAQLRAKVAKDSEYFSKQIDQARAAREPMKPSKPDKSMSLLKSLKSTVKKQKALAKQPSTLGDSDDEDEDADERLASEDEESQALESSTLEQEDEDQLSDDADMHGVMDESSLVDDADSMDGMEPDRE